MRACVSCATTIEETSRFCSSCGASQPTSSSTPTMAAAGPGGAPGSFSTDGRRVSTTDPASHPRFVPGALIAGRYRVVGLLGRGGMGEVYRADDLKLGQPVALKLLPDALSANPSALARFHNEVRLARQVSHPSVCRVYDIGEADGLQFISMEYVDGEDLASLLRRIGRLPEDRAVVIARQVCAGLAAAHDKGMLHRDLKPENVMIDGRGMVRLTDFGLAGYANEITGRELRSGTPAYMAPEQLEGREVTVRSDIYALGLVLYEMFTGRQVFDGPTLADVTRQHATTPPKRPSLHVDTLDPAVERVILRCLEKDPRQRPASALAVSAALPGGDPLAAALAAGETPSPEMVAAAGSGEGIRPEAGLALLLGAIALIVGLAFAGSRQSLLHHVPFSRSAEALVERSRDFLGRLGVPPGSDHAFDIDIDREGIEWLRKRDASAERWKPLGSGRLGIAKFWYRESPRGLYPVSLAGVVTFADPNPYAVSGMVSVALDEGGRLTQFVRVPPQEPGPGAEPRQADWSRALELAGVDLARFKPVPSRWVPPVFADERTAWEGTFPELPDVPFRIEAAAFRGEPVYFEVVAPWLRAARMQPYVEAASQRIGRSLNILLALLGLIGAAALARRNLISGRGDRKGAYRLASWAFGVTFIDWALTADHQGTSAQEWSLFVRGTSVSLFLAVFVWVLYVGLEPMVRRRWPDTLISWSRLLAGRFRDPLVGRDILVGVAVSALLGALQLLFTVAAGHLGPPPTPFVPDPGAILSLRRFLGWFFSTQVPALLSPMLILLMLAVLRQVLRSTAAAVVVCVALITVIAAAVALGNSDGPVWLVVSVVAISLGIYVAVLVRFGLLPMVAAMFVSTFAGAFPATTDPADWYFGYSTVVMGLTVALAIYGFVVSRKRGKSPVVGMTPAR